MEQIGYPNWFEGIAKIFFNKYLTEFKNQPNLRFLQIGAYKGDASIWLLDNVLTNNTSLLIDIDTWLGSNENIHKTFDWNEIEKIYDKSILNYNNVFKFKITSLDFLRIPTNIKYDFIYIDGDHTAAAVYSDAILSWNILKQNGIIAFDDYNWSHESKKISNAPKIGIDLFLDSINGEYEVIEKSHQVWIKKL